VSSLPQDENTMSLRLVYVDESHDSQKFCLSAIIIRHRDWKQCLDECKALRARLREDWGIRPHSEIHAYKLARGKGRRFQTRTLSKWERSRVLVDILRAVAALPGVWILNVALDKSGRRDAHLDAWDRLFNRLERTARRWEDSERAMRTALSNQIAKELPKPASEEAVSRMKAYAPRFMVVADQGREHEITRALRRMHVHNPIPSKFGAWESGSSTKNIVVSRIVEDPIFRESHRSLFIQLADVVAYSLLKREVPPTPGVAKYGINKMFEETIAGACFKPASPSDPLGIVRK
jgi:hypothetical protein